jgi:hypothetical protein
MTADSSLLPVPNGRSFESPPDTNRRNFESRRVLISRNFDSDGDDHVTRPALRVTPSISRALIADTLAYKST